MAYDSVRAQLDKLLGPERNGPLTAPTSAPVSYSDPAVCKHFLLGFCPHDLSIKHRSEPGSCSRQHPAAARAAFAADRAAGKLRAEVSRWTRALLVECRAILADEERKIRGHARRLQETYNAKGDLSGLMIRSFYTLKALGMVRKDAKIRILSEMEDTDDLLTADPVAQDETANLDAASPKEESQALETEPDIKVQKISVPTEVKSDDGNSTSEHGDVVASDDDDMEGFGVIKVIPATKDANEQNTAPATEAERETKDTSDHREENLVTEKRNLQPGDVSKDLPEDKGNTQDNTQGDLCADHHGEKEEPTATDKAAENVAERNETARKEDQSSSVGKETEVSPNKPEDAMEEFYRRGVGPDGLMMLDRKQVLRVCACCGGYISLVDAESRLLSHYGGKSHHSLVQLRDKVAELEKVVATEHRFDDDMPSREHTHPRRDDRESNWSREDRRRSRNWDRPDRHTGRYDRDADHRGYGTAEWYHNSLRGRDDRGRSGYRRSSDEGYHRRDRYNGRYESGRKRYRSRSPNRSRRQRHRY